MKALSKGIDPLVDVIKKIRENKITSGTISDFQKISKSIITITVRKRTKITKCPDCVANTSLLEIENYGLHYYGCKNHPDINNVLLLYYSAFPKNEFNRFQCILFTKIQK